LTFYQRSTTVKVQILQENLKNGLAIASRAVASRSTTLPVLSNVLVTAGEDGRLRLSATNLEIGVHTWPQAKVEEPGAVTVPARTLVDLVNTFGDDFVDLSLNGRTQTLGLMCGRSEARLKGIDAQEFPIVPVEADNEKAKTIALQADKLAEAINLVAFAAAADESRPMLTGVLCKISGGQMTLAAADGFRLSVRTISAPDSDSPMQALIPAKALAELARVLGEDDDVRMSVDPQRVIFNLGHTVLVAQLLDLQFPDYGQIIPKSHTTRAVIDRVALLKACRAANIFARESANTVRFTVKPDTVTLNARSDESGSNENEVDATVDGDRCEIAFNVGYMLDVLNAMHTARVVLELTTPSSPGTLRMIGDDDFTHVLMPMHIG
jgi:DNA polymerase-3 subunit beta